MEFLGRFVGDLGATMAAGDVVRRRPARALPGARRQARDRRRSWPTRTDTDTRYVDRVAARPGRRRLRASTTRRSDTYSLTEEQAFALTDPDGPVFVPGAFQLALGALQAEPRIDGGVPHRRRRRLARARRGRLRRLRAVLPARATSPTWSPAWIPALDGVEEKLRAGAPVADVGCGHGASTRAAGAGVPGVARSSARTTTTARSSRPASGPPRPGSADRVTLRGGDRAGLPRARTTTW